jgi:predicted LPLAT superfamily acyltransferase
MKFEPCAVVPSHNHFASLKSIVAKLREAGLDVIIVDDASEEPARSTISALHAPIHGVEVTRLTLNRGKGGAVTAGLRRASDRGFTHAVQVDADGQHDLASLSLLLAVASAHPEALVSGRPHFDATVPCGRKIGRWITKFWVWVETMSTCITDSMCGFRVYPLTATLALLDTERVGQHMDFDPEIMVRLFWRGTPVIQLPVRVIYPEDNTSNFRMLRDNCLISWMHTRLVLEMIVRLPRILRNRPRVAATGEQASKHWSTIAERGVGWGLKSLAGIYALLGRRGCLAMMWPIVAYFYATDPVGRRSSMEFLGRAHSRSGLPRPTLWTGLRHYMSFAEKVLDTFIAWTGPRRAGPIVVIGNSDLDRLAEIGVGVLLIVSHLGNAELCRASLAARFKRRVNVLLHTRHAALYNGLIKLAGPHFEENTIQVTEVGPDTAIILKDLVRRGEWIAIAGDRTPVLGQSRTSRVPFLGAEAAFSQGPYILAALMGCPVYLMFCLRDGNGHTVHFERFADAISLPRKDKDAALTKLAARYAQRLEHYCLMAPLQWYNFYDFWTARSPAPGTGLTRKTLTPNDSALE